MQKVLKNYKNSVLLLIAIIIGTVCGLVFKENCEIVKPLGDLFLNLLLVIIVPLIFFTITSSIAKMREPKRLSKILLSIVSVFIITAIIAVLVGFISTTFVNLVNPSDTEAIKSAFVDDVADTSEDLSILERTVNALSVDDFASLLSRQNIIALVVMSILIGIAINRVGEKAENIVSLLDSFSLVMYKLIELIMYYAPIGLGCYFASLVGTIGATIAIGFLKTFIMYIIVTLVFFFGFYSLFAYIAGGKDGVKAFWKNIFPSSVTALGTCSSAACVPVSIEVTKKIGVPKDIAETTISLGTSFHKDGSAIGSVFKIMFLVSLFGTAMSMGTVMQILAVSLVATLLVSAVPIGGGTISEMLIISLMGFPVAALPILTIVATIIDAPATLLNVVGDSASAMLVTRLVDGNKWQKKKRLLK